MSKFSYGGDLWSSNASDNFLCSTFHYIAKDWLMRENNISMQEVVGKKSAMRLKQVIDEILVDWKVSEKIFGTVTDSGSNMFGAAKMFPSHVVKIPCAAHRMNSVMKDVFKETKIKVKSLKGTLEYFAKVYHPVTEEYKDTKLEPTQLLKLTAINQAIEETNKVIEQCRHLVGSFNHNGELKRELRTQQAQLNYESRRQLSQESTTRFSDVYNMINSICMNQQALQNMAENTLINECIIEYVPTEEDFEYLDQLANMLYPLQDFIRVISASKYPTISHMYPLVYSLINGEIKKTDVVFNYLQTLKDKLITSMNWRFDYVLKMEIFQACTFLDFRYKQLHFLPKSKRADFKRQAKLHIIELFNKHFKPAGADSVQDSNSENNA